MKIVNRARIGIAASIALGMATLSSSASAQWDPWTDCMNHAWYACAWINGQPSFVTEECYVAEYDACLVRFGELPIGPPPPAARLSEDL